MSWHSRRVLNILILVSFSWVSYSALGLTNVKSRPSTRCWLFKVIIVQYLSEINYLGNGDRNLKMFEMINGFVSDLFNVNCISVSVGLKACYNNVLPWVSMLSESKTEIAQSFVYFKGPPCLM